jgi:hypothetical protein
MKLKNKDKQFIDFYTFMIKYDLNLISYVKITRKVKKSYLKFIFFLNLMFSLLYLMAFSLEAIMITIAILFISFAFFNQYDYSIKLSISNHNLEYNLNPKEISLFYQIEEEYQTQQNLIYNYKNEPSFKSNI